MRYLYIKNTYRVYISLFFGTGICVCLAAQGCFLGMLNQYSRADLCRSLVVGTAQINAQVPQEEPVCFPPSMTHSSCAIMHDLSIPGATAVHRCRDLQMFCIMKCDEVYSCSSLVIGCPGVSLRYYLMAEDTTDYSNAANFHKVFLSNLFRLRFLAGFRTSTSTFDET